MKLQAVYLLLELLLKHIDRSLHISITLNIVFKGIFRVKNETTKIIEIYICKPMLYVSQISLNMYTLVYNVQTQRQL